MDASSAAPHLQHLQLHKPDSDLLIQGEEDCPHLTQVYDLLQMLCGLMWPWPIDMVSKGDIKYLLKPGVKVTNNSCDS